MNKTRYNLAFTLVLLLGSCTSNTSPSGPAINSFTASPSNISSRAAVVLKWSIDASATNIVLDNGLGDQTANASDSLVIYPIATTKYTLTAKNGSGTSTATVTVNVQYGGIPGVGSTFTMAITDATGPGQPELWYVVQSHIAFKGKSNVMIAIDTNLGLTLDSMEIGYESNGDVSTYIQTNSNVKRWVLLPVSTQTSTLPIRDTTTNPTQYYNIVATGNGTGSEVVDGKTLPTQLVKLTQTLTDTAGVSSSNLEYFRYAPSIGLFVLDTILGDSFTRPTSKRLIKDSVNN
jgi:hypothetical protein